jgi:hypothetical protein
MSEHMPDALDARLSKLSPEVPPGRDLWPEIAAVLKEPVPHASQVQRHPARFAPGGLWQLAAVVLLMVASSAVTYLLTQRSFQGQLLQARQETMRQMQPVLTATPASFGYQRLGAEYARVHAELDAQSTRYLRSLPSAERIKVESSLADLRRAAGELSRRLAEHPSDPLLQELLLSTYQNEIGLLTRVNDLAAAAGLGADL